MHLKCVLYLTRRPPEIQNLIYKLAKMTENEISAKKQKQIKNTTNTQTFQTRLKYQMSLIYKQH